MLLRLCQLKSLALLMLLTLSGCAFFSWSSDHAAELLTPMKNEWFSNNPRHALYDQQGKPQPHHFFDVNPELSKTDVYVNAVVLVPEGSDHSYQLDLASGQRFYSHTYCPQSDIWNQYSGSIGKPIFNIGVIPRMLDQLGEPQEVIIFGGAKKYSKLGDFHQHRVRLIGAIVEQACPEGNCLGRDNWISKMVFLAVDVEDKKLQNVTDIVTLQQKIDWPQTKAVIENLDGRNGGGKTNYPAIRVGKLIKLDEAIDYYKKRSIYLSEEEAKKIRNSCHALYDKLWEDVGKERDEDKAAKTIEELNTKLKIREELRKKGKPTTFAARLKNFSKKYYAEFSTCQKFVYAGNINQDRDQFWFLSYAGIFFRLHKDGYFYDCRIKSWQKNSLNNSGEPIYDIKTGMVDCSDRDYDTAMEYLPNFLTSIKNSESNYYKFVDYDTHTFGTHQKLYSWVKLKSKKYDCHSDPNSEIRKELKVFPDDINWKSRDVKDIADELKIIY